MKTPAVNEGIQGGVDSENQNERHFVHWLEVCRAVAPEFLNGQHYTDRDIADY